MSLLAYRIQIYYHHRYKVPKWKWTVALAGDCVIVPKQDVVSWILLMKFQPN